MSPAKRKLLLYSGIVVLGLACIFTVKTGTDLLMGMINQHPKFPEYKTVVTGHEWSRTRTTGYYKASDGEGWQLPAGAELIRIYQVTTSNNRVLSYYKTQERTIQVQNGTLKVPKQRDLGNGQTEIYYETKPAYLTKTITERVPVYKNVSATKTKYVYRIRQWVTTNTFKATEQNKKPYWPKMTQGTDDINSKEEYYLLVNDEQGKPIKVATRQEFWQQVNPKDTITLRKTNTGLEVVESSGLFH